MPSGKTHDRIALISLFPTFLAGYYFFKDIGLASFLAMFTLLGAYLLGPDLDTKSSNYYRWGPLKFIWLPYRKVIKHRSRLSHSFVVGPALKMLYLVIVFLIGCGVISYFMLNQDFSFFVSSQKNNFQQIYFNFKIYIIIAFVGILWANAQHLITDFVVSLYLKK